MSPDPLQQIWPIFTAETREQLQAAGACLLALERAPGDRPPGLMETLKRALHSAKGGAGSLGFSNFEQLAHALETALVGHAADAVLPRELVDRLLGGFSALEAMLRTIDAGVGDTAPADYAAALAALGHEVPVSTPSLVGVPPGEHLSLELWPIFRTDVCDSLTLLADSARARKDVPGEVELKRLFELANAVEQSGATLGLTALERGGAELRGLLEAPWTRETEPALTALVHRLEKVVADTDERVEALLPTAPAATPGDRAAIEAPRAVPEAFFAEARGLLTDLEGAMGRLLTPHPEQRAAVEEEVRQRAHRLKGTVGAVLGGAAGELAVELHGAARALGAGGVEGAMASASLARLLVALGQALDAARASAPPPSAPRPEPKPTASPGVADTVVRVSRNALEALTDVLDRTAMARARRAAQLRHLLELRGQAREASLWAERARSELRAVTAAAPHLDGARARLRELSTGLKRVSTALWRDLETEQIQGAQLKETLRELRTVPAQALGELLRRTARETAGRVGKSVRLELLGGEVRLDRRIVDSVRDPLLHLLRNAIDHGLEAPQTRLQQGKPAEGCLVLRVEERGGRVCFSLADDGAGLDLERIRERALSRALYDERALAALSDAEVARLIFLPGFSTARAVTELSGRGVGLDVVDAFAKAIGGSVSVTFERGLGTTFVLDLPRALGALLGLVVRVGTQRLVFPNDAVGRLLRLRHRDFSVVDGRPMALVGQSRVPFVSLARLLELPGARLPLEEGRPVQAVLLSAPEGTLAVGVDEVLDHQELLVHALGRHLRESRHLAGAAQLNDGTVVPVLHAGELIALATSQATTRRANGAPILVVDDALSSRAVVRHLLELAGFEVWEAAEGEEAWGLLVAHPFSLLITDLQMPGLDGLGLMRRVRADARFAQLPMVALTAQDTAEDRAVGLEAGADAYLVKRDLERGALLERVRQLLVVSE
ncbi:MAG: response regulator [Myxococcus sp.]|nr:response regulator [Myxococcus sp.]